MQLNSCIRWLIQGMIIIISCNLLPQPHPFMCFYAGLQHFAISKAFLGISLNTRRSFHFVSFITIANAPFLKYLSSVLIRRLLYSFSFKPRYAERFRLLFCTCWAWYEHGRHNTHSFSISANREESNWRRTNSWEKFPITFTTLQTANNRQYE